MSLVNQMLKDLESRRAPEMGGEAVLSDLAVAPASSAAPLFPWSKALIVLLIVTIGGSGFYWYTMRTPAPLSTAQPIEPVRREERVPQTSVIVPAAVETKATDPRPETRAPMALVASPESEAERPVVAREVSHSPQSIAAAPRVEPTDTREPEPVHAASTATKQAVAVAKPPSLQPPAEQRTRKNDPVIERVSRPQSPREKAEGAYHKGADLVRQGHLNEAEATLREALALDPDLVEAREVLAALLIRTQRSAEAEAALKSGLERDRGAYPLARIYARLLAERGEQREAVVILESSLPAPAMDPDYYGLLAALYQRTGQHARAVAAYRRVLAVASERGPWWMGFAISLERTKRPQEAVQAYRRARGAAGMNPQLLQFVSERLVALGAE